MWEVTLTKDVNGLVRLLREDRQHRRYGLVSVAAVPVFQHGKDADREVDKNLC